jgi:hypothetical protein
MLGDVSIVGGKAASIAGLAVQSNSLTPIFPVISVPVAVIVLDGVNHIQQVIDMRSSYPSDVPTFPDYLGPASENTSDPTKRVLFQNNFYVLRTRALSPQIPQDVNLSVLGFLLATCPP